VFYLLFLLITNLQFASARAINSFYPPRESIGSLFTITGTYLSSPTALFISEISAIAMQGAEKKGFSVLISNKITLKANDTSTFFNKNAIAKSK
jgi:hypothetical protein